MCMASNLSLSLSLPPSLFLSLSLSGGGRGGDSKDRVLLEKVSAITLEEGKTTTGRRSSPVQQVMYIIGIPVEP